MFRKLLDEIFSGKSRLPRSVLIVEDDAFLKPMLARILYSMNQALDLTWVTSAGEARNTLGHRPFDLLITDVLLDGPETGVDLYRHCKTRYPNLPILVVSGLSQKTIAKMGPIDVDNLAYVSKPIVPTECRDSIRSLMAR